MHRRDLLTGAGVLAVAGCVAPITAPPEPLAGVRRVAIITAFDPELALS